MVSPAAKFSRMASTVMRVPAMTGSPIMTLGRHWINPVFAVYVRSSLYRVRAKISNGTGNCRVEEQPCLHVLREGIGNEHRRKVDTLIFSCANYCRACLPLNHAYLFFFGRRG